ncbi:unnamed protein product [Phytomonas sp. EM1]|nr:unnamed protein product [Phytomonas sp. EM1]|eukprot:CCW62722.1 unnamed protein product [Phytomonas sp. isolate EM1]
MSWQDYIDKNLIGSGNMHSSAIIGLKDGCYWAHGGTYLPQPEEIKHIQRCLEDLSLINSSGITINGVKFFGLQSGVDGDTRFIFFKKGPAGGCIYTTKQTFIIGVYGNPTGVNSLQEDLQGQKAQEKVVNPALCNSSVKFIVKYLINLGY